MSLDEPVDNVRSLIDSKYPINMRTGSVERIRQIKRVRNWYYDMAVKCINGDEENNIIEEWLNEGN